MKMKSICSNPNSEGNETPLLNSVSDGRVISNSALKRKKYGMDNSNRTSHCNVGHSIGSSGKTFEKTPGQRNSRTGLQKRLMHCSKTLCNGGVSLVGLSF